jgi:hypothetical protein
MVQQRHWPGTPYISTQVWLWYRPINNCGSNEWTRTRLHQTVSSACVGDLLVSASNERAP